MEKKLIKKDYYNMLLDIKEVSGNALLVDFINHELELLERKSTSKTATKTQLENEEIKKIIVSELGKIAKPVTISELQELSESLAPYRNQKLTALMTQLYNKGNGVLERQEIKGKAYYSTK
jgi:hypothetical protein